MNALYARCARGRPMTVIVEGGAGCGKSALVDTLAHHAAERGATVIAPPSLLPSQETPTARDAQAYADRLADLARENPVVICHDDPQGRDEHTTRLLLEAVRRLRGSRVMLLLTMLPFGGTFTSAIRRDLLRQPHVHRVQLRLLLPEQSREQWNLLGGDTFFHGSAEDAHTISGGNPLLLRALAEELGMPMPMTSWPQPHGLFVQSAVDCARDSGPLALKVATGIAALGEFADHDSVATVLGLSPAETTHGRSLLHAAGLVHGWRVRHPAVAAGLLDRLEESARTALGTEVAELLRRRGASVTDLAHHLLDTRAATGAWQATTLECAAAEALDHDDAEFADACLALAQDATTDCWNHVRLELKRYALRMRTAPWTAGRTFLDRVRTTPCPHGDNPCQARAVLHARLLLDCGRLEESAAVLQTMSAQPKPSGDESHHTWPWLFRVAPGLAHFPPTVRAIDASLAGTIITDLFTYDACFSSLSHGHPEPYEVEELLRSLALGDTTLGLILPALTCLSRTGCPDLAEIWAAHFLRQATERGVEGWRQIFTAVRAQAALARGRLAEAEEHARAVLTASEAEPSYSLHGGALAVLVDVCAATGRYEEATRLLDRPLPDDFSRSFFSLTYLEARGHFLIGLGRPHLALSDFLTIGQRAEHWLVPDWAQPAWRIDAAETWLRIGGDEEAAELLAEHEAAAPGDKVLFPGQWLRARARLARPQERTELLARGIEQLRESSGGWILAGALADLAESYQDLGLHGPAELALREAAQLAEESRARTLLERIAGLTEGERPHRGALRGPRSVDPTTKLSDSELRVAVLAAQGRTNREISEELFITVSTVEQHLTRVYRKLDITSRQELPLHVESALSEAA
ncbi:LuxR C-terminal-related transcriptional regulator [Streptomyces sp. NPDC004539]|uniref:helix-turn-helix transcriptional regulator n=1 Tax=Streptomyces sp. NPDC004539 TaxID=3154280 RepID=UPI0033A1C5F7